MPARQCRAALQCLNIILDNQCTLRREMSTQALASKQKRRVGRRRDRALRTSRFLLVGTLATFIGVVFVSRARFPSRAYPAARLPTEDILRARRISADEGLVNVMFYNLAYITLVKSWICNVLEEDVRILNVTLFIAADRQAGNDLRDFHPGLWVTSMITLDHGLDDALSYGSYAYFYLTLERLLIQNELLQHGVNVLLTEADAVWLSSSVQRSLIDRLATAQIISASDHSQHLISAGFLLCKSDAKVRVFFKDYVRSYARRLERIRPSDPHERIDHLDAGEQHLMTKLLHKSQLVVEWLDSCEYARGEWYSDEEYRRRCPHPLVIQNNYIVGIQAKVHRAQRWGHWYLLGDEQSCST